MKLRVQFFAMAMLILCSEEAYASDPTPLVYMAYAFMFLVTLPIYIVIWKLSSTLDNNLKRAFIRVIPIALVWAPFFNGFYLWPAWAIFFQLDYWSQLLISIPGTTATGVILHNKFFSKTTKNA
jgi:hypothetical protein